MQTFVRPILYLIFISVLLLQPVKQPSTTAYLPVVYMHEKNPVGVVSESSCKTTIKQLNRFRTLMIHAVWAWAEPEKGQYDLDRIIGKVCQLDIDVIVVKASPPWALKYGQPACMLPQERHWDSLAVFIQLIIDTFHPAKIGVWNEPFAKTHEWPYNFGCYADGNTYGRLVAYIKQNTYGAEIIAGNVANIYDSNVIPMLNAMGDHFDYLGFHCYPHFYNYLYTNCAKEFAYAHKITDKPAILTEFGVMYKWGTEANYRKAQKELLEWADSTEEECYWYTLMCNGWPAPPLIPTDLCPCRNLTEKWPACEIYKH